MRTVAACTLLFVAGASPAWSQTAEENVALFVSGIKDGFVSEGGGMKYTATRTSASPAVFETDLSGTKGQITVTQIAPCIYTMEFAADGRDSDTLTLDYSQVSALEVTEDPDGVLRTVKFNGLQCSSSQAGECDPMILESNVASKDELLTAYARFKNEICEGTSP
ncbi:hypothetical protein [Antarcticirhabdus aurantiaca]|uniref:Uncharacterized protein n=1 Tax=Antarcticirhabdus aurantiaca TaxID=2606717 RepID=A0ACD4NKS3_9HYPH|nr:hypothetical protein [Antarcticirhabdus aurantiaca]WAJ27389.1 hypothetical protein OXU80_21460 [Jeongeuplla avenae]